jgi:uncharacterized membrane protein
MASPDKELEMLVQSAAPDLLKGLPSNKKSQLLHVVGVLVEQQQSYSGPTPPHEMLEGYNRAIPDGGDRLFRLVEGQTNHRQALENRVVDGQLKESGRGQIFAFILALLTLGIGTAAFLTDHDTVAGVIFGTTVISLTGVFIAGKLSQKKDLEKKRPPR